MEIDLKRDCKFEGDLNPWSSDASSHGSCSLVEEGFEAAFGEVVPCAVGEMAFPARISNRPIVEGRFGDRNPQTHEPSQVNTHRADEPTASNQRRTLSFPWGTSGWVPFAFWFHPGYGALELAI
ncbi:hypothetical protein KC19_VG131200 [Ceratodon purpureus]|uniref:Uncharacterized protein n=1 Tax=Ceratodon purpureus TaxID=3225 RepID=A0A8T0HQN5_CERPU|nr:hypothetical protein KC19_VG131200 [Ceratodon purpureus]